jgi:membrane protease YdiL (CAAX protease family)
MKTGNSPAKAWLVLGVMIVAGMIVGNLLGLLWVSPETRMTFLQGEYDINTPGVIPDMRQFQAISSLFTFFVPAVWFNFWYRKEKVDLLGVHGRFPLSGYFIVAVAIMASIPWINAVVAWSETWDVPAFFSEMQNRNEDLIKAFLHMENRSDLIWNLTVMALIPALGEEFLFRGCIQPMIQKSTGKVHLAVWLTAFLFAAMHMQIVGFLAMLILGAFLGYLRLYGGNIWLPVLGHYMNNSMMVFGAYILAKEGIPMEALDAPGAEAGQWWMAVVSFLFLLGSVFLIKELARRPQ